MDQWTIYRKCQRIKLANTKLVWNGPESHDDNQYAQWQNEWTIIAKSKYLTGSDIGVVTLAVTETVVEIGELAKRLPGFASELSEYLQRTISQEFLMGIYNQIQWMYTQLDPDFKLKVDSTIGSGITTITHAGQDLVVKFLNGLKNLLVSLPNLATVFFRVDANLAKLQNHVFRGCSCLWCRLKTT